MVDNSAKSTSPLLRPPGRRGPSRMPPLERALKGLHVQQEAEHMPFSTTKPVNEMNLVEIAEQLEKVTSWIEAQRVKEREARVIYQSVAQQVESAVGQIRTYAQQLVDAQQRKI